MTKTEPIKSGLNVIAEIEREIAHNLVMVDSKNNNGGMFNENVQATRAANRAAAQALDRSILQTNVAEGAGTAEETGPRSTSKGPIAKVKSFIRRR